MKRNLTDSELDTVSGGSWEPYTMDPNAVRCECGSNLQLDVDETGRADLGHYHCPGCGISYYKNDGVWMIDRSTKHSSGGC